MIKIKNMTLAKGIVVLLAIAAVGGGTAYAGSVVSRNNIMDQDAAEIFAMVDAGVDKNKVTSLHSHLERDRGKYVYDVEFHVGDIEYEYEVLAEDGTILNKNVDGDTTLSHEAVDSVKTASAPSGQEAEGIQDIDWQDQDTEESNADSSRIDYIGVHRAKQIALDHAGFRENEVIFSKAKFDKKDNDDDGPEYEIEFYKDKIEYEYEIDALTGKINDSSAEPDDD